MHRYSSSSRFLIKVTVICSGLLTLLLSGCGGGGSSTSLLSGTTGSSDESSTTAWQLVWSDEFDGSTLDTTNWTYDLGDGSSQGIPGWGNNELQVYREENTSVSGGLLTIEARQESFASASYTSSRIKTEGKRFFRYGKVEVRAKLPEGQGLWPAIWMLGENISSTPWPASGEIDIMEMVGGSGQEDTVHGTIHWDNSGAHAYSGGQTSLTSATFADDFHVFSIEWDASEIIWLVDGVEYHTESIVTADKTELHKDFFILLNVSVGGDWPGSPDSTTSFPQQMLVDYVRVYQAS